MAQQLTQLRTSLNLPNHQDRDQDELLKLGEKCSAIAKDLITELQTLKVGGPHRKRQAIEKTIKSIWKKTAIDAIQKRLDDCRKVLDHRVLIDLRKRSDLSSIQQNEGFQSLDLKVQTIITSLAQGPKTFKELKALIQNNTQSIKEHVTNELQRHQRDLAHKEYCQRFLDSLWFPEIHRRQETIHEAHEKTFQWIFESEESGKTVRRWDNFVHWLEKGQSTYWINGKAGSGKSTLMNYIYQDARTMASLKAWSGPKEIVTLGFFFWNAGGTLEKSSEGLLRSLVYQILKRFPSLTPSSQIGSSPLSMQNGPLSYEPIAAWTERRLQVSSPQATSSGDRLLSALRRSVSSSGRNDIDSLQTTFESVLRQVQEVCRICVFVDGLDEFSGDQDMLIKLIGKVQTADVKVCLSSRPYRSYSEAFGSWPKLQLQDLTESDIKIYVSNKLDPFVKTNYRKGVYDIFDTVVYKAKGVFLWVELVVKDLIKGLKEDDTLEQLQERLELMPSGIEDLYAHMLSKIDKVYRTQAAKLFQMALSDLTKSLFTFALALFGRFDKVSDVCLSDTLSCIKEARNKIPTICAGLLEVHVWGERVRGGTFRSADPSLSLVIQYDESSELAEVKLFQNHASVDFIHRTAQDYFEQSEQGKHFLDAYSPPAFNPHISLVHALLTEANLLGFADIRTDERAEDFADAEDDTDYDYHKQDKRASEAVYVIMENISVAERQAEAVQVSLCDDIDRTFSAIHNRRGLPTPMILREIMENISVAERQNGTTQVSICAEYDDVLVNMNRRSSPKAHWSVRWGICSKFFFTEGCEISWSGLSSRSNSAGLFHSTNTEPGLLENSRVLHTRPVDFLGIAALWGLSRYVEQKLGCEGETVAQDRADYLLCCSMWAFHQGNSGVAHSDRFLRSCKFTAEILRLGGNCNIYVEDFLNTLWGDFLTQMMRLLHDGRHFINRACAMATSAFLENGADLNVRIHREVAVTLSGVRSLEGQRGLHSKEELEFFCIEESTALYAIQEYFSDMPEFKPLQGHILNNVGRSSSRWTHVGLNNSRPNEISEQQSHALRAAIHDYRATDFEDDDSIQRRQEWALTIARLYKEIRGTPRAPDSLDSANEE